MLMRLVLIGLAAMIGASAEAATSARSQAQVSQCLNGKVSAYRREMGSDRDVTAAQLQEWERECGRAAPPPLRLSGRVAADTAHAGRSLFVLGPVRAQFQQRTQGNSGLPVPIPSGRFQSESSADFALTRVCEDAPCSWYTTALVDVTTGDIAFCSDPGGSQTIWHFENQPMLLIPKEPGQSNFCPQRLAQLRSDLAEAWRGAQRERGLKPGLAAVTGGQPSAGQVTAPVSAQHDATHGREPVRESAKACFDRKLAARIAAMGPGKFPPPGLALQWETECAANPNQGAAGAPR